MKWSEKGTKICIVLWGILPLFLWMGSGPVVSWSQENSMCLGCHQDENLSKEDARGKKVSLFVSEERFKESSHGQFSCSDCHLTITDDAHAEGGKKAADPRVDCGACHPGELEEYQQGIHAKTVKGRERAAHCHDCHEKHYILPEKNPKSMVHPSNIQKTCDRCHSDREFMREHALSTMGLSPGELFKESVHALTGAVTCTGCHGSHNMRSLIDPKSAIFRANITQTCGTCHPDTSDQFKGGIHGVLAARGRSDAPTCTTCHGIHGIKAILDPASPVHERRIALTTCPQCHAAERITKEYRITTIPVTSYYDSFHGLSYRGGDTYSANCASCHGVHDIRPSSDPQSLVHVDNLQNTCGSCHPRASVNFARGKIHSVASIRGEDFGEVVVGWVRIIYIFLIVIVIGGMTFFNFTDWLRKTIDRKP